MTQIDLYWDDYYAGLLELVNYECAIGTSASLLLNQLTNMDYYHTNPIDDAPELWAKRELRGDYYLHHKDEMLFEYDIAKATWLEYKPVSVFEGLVAVAQYMENNWMGDIDEGDRTYLWFSLFLENLGIEQYLYCPIEDYNTMDVHNKLAKWMERDWDCLGKGSLFPIPAYTYKFAQDCRHLETKGQMSQYICLMNLAPMKEADRIRWVNYMTEMVENNKSNSRGSHYIPWDKDAEAYVLENYKEVQF